MGVRVRLFRSCCCDRNVDCLGKCLCGGAVVRTFVRGFGVRICTEKHYDMKFVAEIDIMPLAGTS